MLKNAYTLRMPYYSSEFETFFTCHMFFRDVYVGNIALYGNKITGTLYADLVPDNGNGNILASVSFAWQRAKAMFAGMTPIAAYHCFSHDGMNVSGNETLRVTTRSARKRLPASERRQRNAFHRDCARLMGQAR